jgi:hypothetical protein
MRAIARRASALLAVLLAAIMFNPGPAAAATASWTSHTYCSNNIQVQGHYLYYYSGGLRYVRADGYATYLGSGTGYLRGVVVSELRNGQTWGVRSLNFTGTQKSSSLTGITESYLPYVLSSPTSVVDINVDVWDSFGNHCTLYRRL